jgi:hypothetical protein
VSKLRRFYEAAHRWLRSELFGIRITEADRTGTLSSRAHTSTERGEVFVRVHYFTLDWLKRGLIVSAVVESDPQALILIRSTDFRPGLSIAHDQSFQARPL